MCPKHWVREVMANPEAKAVARRTDAKEAPTPTPSEAPQTISTYTNEDMHSEITDLQNSRVRISTCTGVLVVHTLTLSLRKASIFSNKVKMWYSMFWSLDKVTLSSAMATAGVLGHELLHLHMF